MGRREAQEVAAWRYDPPYDFYDITDEGINELVGGGYYALRAKDNRLAAFFCIGDSALVPGGDYVGAGAVVDIGVGLRPDLTGHGRGGPFLADLLDWIGVVHPDADTVRLTVAEFNQRAIRLYERGGFHTVGRFVHAGGTGFQTMQRAMRSTT